MSKSNIEKIDELIVKLIKQLQNNTIVEYDTFEAEGINVTMYGYSIGTRATHSCLDVIIRGELIDKTKRIVRAKEDWRDESEGFLVAVCIVNEYNSIVAIKSEYAKITKRTRTTILSWEIEIPLVGLARAEYVCTEGNMAIISLCGGRKELNIVAANSPAQATDE